MTTIIRAARPGDAEALGRSHWAAWREAYAALLPSDFWTPEAEEARVAGWHRILASPYPGSTTVVALRDGEVVGHASAGPSRPNGTAGAPVRDRELWSAYVLATEYGTGTGARLLEAVLPAGTPAELWVLEANPRARAFYAKHGFAADGARHVLGPEVGGRPEIRMVR